MADLPRSCDVVVIGAGLAGLCAARHLVAAGRDVVVVEAGDAVGGRVRTDHVDGLQLDRGFQVSTPGYPEARRVLDLDALDLHRFTAGAVVATEGRRHRLAAPFDAPRWALNAVTAPVGSPADKLRMAAYAARVGVVDARRLVAQEDVTARQALRDAGLSDRFVDTALRPFLAGVFLEEELSTSRRFLDLVLRSFVRGLPALPAAGMGAIPEQLASTLPDGCVHLGVRVRSLLPGRVSTDAGDVQAPAVIVATSGPEAAALVPGVDAPASKASTTWYHLADVPPDALVEGRPVLTLDGDGTGPISSTVPLSHVSASYASGGRVLVTSLAVGERGSADDERAARKQLAALYGEATGGWDHVATYVVPHSLPAMPPPHDFRRPVVVTDGLYVCGDHRDSASQQGAMVSGRRAAESILAAARTSSAPA